MGASVGCFVAPNSFGAPHPAFKPRLSHVSEPDHGKILLEITRPSVSEINGLYRHGEQ